MAYFHGDGLHFETVATHSQPNHTGLAVQGFVLVEYEIAHTVIDLMTAVFLYGLEGVGVVTHKYVGTSQYEHVGIVALTGYGLQFVLCTPVEGNNDNGCGVLLTKMVHA